MSLSLSSSADQGQKGLQLSRLCVAPVSLHSSTENNLHLHTHDEHKHTAVEMLLLLLLHKKTGKEFLFCFFNKKATRRITEAHPSCSSFEKKKKKKLENVQSVQHIHIRCISTHKTWINTKPQDCKEVNKLQTQDNSVHLQSCNTELFKTITSL